MTPELQNLLTIVAGAILTLMILSYLIGDSFLFRLAVHVLVGAGAAYAAVTVLADVISARLVQPFIQRNDALALLAAGAGLFLSVLLLFKLSPRLGWIGNLPVGYLVGVGAAIALGGAMFGTLGPQIMATASPAGSLLNGTDENGGVNFLLNVIVLVGTIVTLLSFGYYRAARGSWLSNVNMVGRRFFLMVAFGATFALVFIASTTLLIGRLEALIQAVGILSSGPK